MSMDMVGSNVVIKQGSRKLLQPSSSPAGVGNLVTRYIPDEYGHGGIKRCHQTRQ